MKVKIILGLWRRGLERILRVRIKMSIYGVCQPLIGQIQTCDALHQLLVEMPVAVVKICSRKCKEKDLDVTRFTFMRGFKNQT
jgi:hypothetical protein